ncbi:hypothetical protein V1520DRAFT_284712, partial [Lipomyces starkeyi]
RKLEEERRKLEEQAEDRVREAEEHLQQQTQQTTFEEFIECCHTFLSEPLKIEPDKEVLLAPSRFLPSRGELKGVADFACLRPLASEKDLEIYESQTVVEPMGSFFTITQAHLTVTRTNLYSQKGNRSVGDQFCVLRAKYKARILLYTIEYKPAHKLSAEYLRSGLREMNFWEEVVPRVTIPTDRDEKFKFHAERSTGKAVAQVYNGMIHDGLAHACLTNGYCKVFFHVSEDHPEIYYFLSEPNEDVRKANDKANTKKWFQQPITAVGRMLSL